MRVEVSLTGFLDGREVQVKELIDLKPRDTLQKLFRRADAALGFKRPHRPFRAALKTAPPPLVMINGAAVDLPVGLDRRLKDGDQVNIVALVAGG